MKRFLILIAMTVFALPVFASCPIDGGACTASNTESGLLEKYVPDNLEEMQKTDAFQPNYITPYNDALINIEPSQTPLPKPNDYNSNCQFGVCLPGVEPGGEIIE